MRRLRHKFSGWRGALVVVAICSLTFSLATRFWVLPTSQSHTVRSAERQSVESGRQRLEQDAAQWVAPTSDFSIVEFVSHPSSPIPDGPPLPKFAVSDSLYNRPPPSSQFLL